MITSYDKFIVAVLGCTVFAVNNFTSFHFGMSEEQIDAIASAITPVLVWLVPNRG